MNRFTRFAHWTSKESAMNDTSGSQEERSSNSQSLSYRVLHEQQHQFETGSWHHFHPQQAAGITELNFENFSEAEANPVARYEEYSSSRREKWEK
jgi:hypothetical protein